MAQTRVCKFLRHPQEAFSVGKAIDAEPKRMDPLEIDLCVWVTEKNKGHELPPVIQRRIGGGADLNDGDCDRCHCFEPVQAPAFGGSRV